MERRLFLRLTAASAIALIGNVARADDDVDEALEKITKARAKIKTLQAPFNQTRVIGLLASEVKSKGKLTLKRPDRLRWDLYPPDDVTYWIGPEGLAMRNKDGVTRIGKASANKFAAVLGDLMIMLGGDMKKLKKRYEISVEKDGDKLELTAKPKAKEVKKHISRLKLFTGKDASVVHTVEIHEKSGDKSIIVFGKYTKNAKVKDEDMKPPEDD
jgi:outer membrane lipoprotein-sorting protein